MPANIDPIFSAKGAIQWSPSPLSAANATRLGTGAVATVFTGNAAGNAAGNFVQRLIARPLGTNVATVLRLFVNNGSDNNVAENNTLFDEISLPATVLSETAALPSLVLPLNLILPAGYKLNCTLGTAVAAGFDLTVIGGEY